MLLRGLRNIFPMESEPLKSLIGAQLVPPLVLFQMPPPSVPAQSVRVVVVPVLSMSKSFTRPTGCAYPVRLVQPVMDEGKPALFGATVSPPRFFDGAEAKPGCFSPVSAICQEVSALLLGLLKTSGVDLAIRARQYPAHIFGIAGRLIGRTVPFRRCGQRNCCGHVHHGNIAPGLM